MVDHGQTYGNIYIMYMYTKYPYMNESIFSHIYIGKDLEQNSRVLHPAPFWFPLAAPLGDLRQNV